MTVMDAWSGETCSAWDLYLVVDTTSDAIHFADELLAATTGLSTDNSEVADEIAKAYVGPSFRHLVLRTFDPSGDVDTGWDFVSVCETPGSGRDGARKFKTKYRSVRIRLSRALSEKQLAGFKQRAFAFAKIGYGRDVDPFGITGFRYVQERRESRTRSA